MAQFRCKVKGSIEFGISKRPTMTTRSPRKRKHRFDGPMRSVLSTNLQADAGNFPNLDLVTILQRMSQLSDWLDRVCDKEPCAADSNGASDQRQSRNDSRPTRRQATAEELAAKLAGFLAARGPGPPFSTLRDAKEPASAVASSRSTSLNTGRPL